MFARRLATVVSMDLPSIQVALFETRTRSDLLLNIPEQNRTDYLFDVNYTVSCQSNTTIIYISRS